MVPGGHKFWGVTYSNPCSIINKCNELLLSETLNEYPVICMSWAPHPKTRWSMECRLWPFDWSNEPDLSRLSCIHACEPGLICGACSGQWNICRHNAPTWTCSCVRTGLLSSSEPPEDTSPRGWVAVWTLNGYSSLLRIFTHTHMSMPISISCWLRN